MLPHIYNLNNKEFVDCSCLGSTISFGECTWYILMSFHFSMPIGSLYTSPATRSNMNEQWLILRFQWSLWNECRIFQSSPIRHSKSDRGKASGIPKMMYLLPTLHPQKETWFTTKKMAPLKKESISTWKPIILRGCIRYTFRNLQLHTWFLNNSSNWSWSQSLRTPLLFVWQRKAWQHLHMPVVSLACCMLQRLLLVDFWRFFGMVATWRIIPVSKWVVTPIYKPFRPFGRGTTLLRGLIPTMVINHVP